MPTKQFHIRGLGDIEISPFTFSEEMIDLHDMAQGLTQARWLGRTSRPLTVNEHSLRVASKVMEECKFSESAKRRAGLVGLLHDAHESYTQDWPAPYKRHTLYVALNPMVEHVQSVIWRWAGVTATDLAEWLPLVHQVDQRMLQTEHSVLRPLITYPLDLVEHPIYEDIVTDIRDFDYRPTVWVSLFIARFADLRRL